MGKDLSEFLDGIFADFRWYRHMTGDTWVKIKLTAEYADGIELWVRKSESEAYEMFEVLKEEYLGLEVAKK